MKKIPISLALKKRAMKKEAHNAKEIGERLRALRKERGLSQGELGEKSGIHFTHISRCERGLSQPTADTLRRLADALNVSVSAIMDEATEEPTFEDPELRKKLSEIERLPADDRMVVIKLLDAFLFKKRVQDFAAQ